MKLPLKTAQSYASKIKDWLEPGCDRIEIAGSVRRGRPLCSDIDLVCIPKFQQRQNDLLGDPVGTPLSLLNEFLTDYVARSEGKAWFRSTDGILGFKAVTLNSASVNVLMQLPKCELDVFAATAETFVMRWIIRTGSVEHNIFIADRARALGGHLDPQNGLMLDGQLLAPKTEEEFYAALNLPFIEPQDRERDFLRRFAKP
jgi:DNA polymerase/3'-5' exonuclease PolX